MIPNVSNRIEALAHKLHTFKPIFMAEKELISFFQKQRSSSFYWIASPGQSQCSRESQYDSDDDGDNGAGAVPAVAAVVHERHFERLTHDGPVAPGAALREGLHLALPLSSQGNVLDETTP